MKFSHLNLFIQDRIATLKLNRPKALNALNKEMIKELHRAVEFLDENNDVRVVILTGEGEKSFVAGADITEFKDCLLYTSPSPRDRQKSRMPSSA